MSIICLALLLLLSGCVNETVCTEESTFSSIGCAQHYTETVRHDSETMRKAVEMQVVISKEMEADND